MGSKSHQELQSEIQALENELSEVDKRPNTLLDGITAEFKRVALESQRDESARLKQVAEASLINTVGKLISSLSSKSAERARIQNAIAAKRAELDGHHVVEPPKGGAATVPRKQASLTRKQRADAYCEAHGIKFKAELYRAAKVDHSQYYKWERGELKDNSAVDRAIRRIIDAIG